MENARIGRAERVADELVTVNTPFGRYLTTRVERFRFGQKALGETEEQAWDAAWRGKPAAAMPAGIVPSDLGRFRSALSCDELVRRLSASEIRHLKGDRP